MTELTALQARLDASPEMQRKIANGMLAEALAEAQTLPPRKDPFLWFDGMAKVSRPPQLVKGVLPAGCLAVVFGESGSGKTFFTTDMALHIAAELRWRDHRVNGGLTVYVAAEAAGSVSNRVAAWRRINPLISSASFAVLPAAINLLDASAVANLTADILEAAERLKIKPALVVFDTLARCIAGADENSAADIGAAVGACDEIRTATGATVLLVHHSGKDVARGARGSSALRAAVDVEIAVEGQSGTRTAAITKSRDAETGIKFAFDLEPVELGTDEDGDAISSLIVRPVEIVPETPKAQGKQQQRLLAELERLQAGQEERMTWTVAELREVGRELGMHKNTASSAVTGLLQIGLIVPQIGGNYLASYVPPQDRKDRNGPKRTISSRTTGTEKTEGSIRPRSSVRASALTGDAP